MNRPRSKHLRARAAAQTTAGSLLWFFGATGALYRVEREFGLKRFSAARRTAGILWMFLKFRLVMAWAAARRRCDDAQ